MFALVTGCPPLLSVLALVAVCPLLPLFFLVAGPLSAVFLVAGFPAVLSVFVLGVGTPGF